MLKSILLPILFLCAYTSASSQVLSYYRPVLGNVKFFKDDVKISKKEYKNYLKEQPKSHELLKQSKRNGLKSLGCYLFQWVFVILQVREAFDRDIDFGSYYLIPNFGIGIGSTYFQNKSRNLFRLSTNEYNNTKH